MHPRVYQEFERICSGQSLSGAVLEVGVIAGQQSLLNLKSLESMSERIGIDLEGPTEHQEWKIVKGNANSMTCFEDNKFDVVLCNAVLEHDKFFWKTLAEIRRVAKPGGLVVIGVPGFVKYPAEKYIHFVFGRIPLIRRVAGSTITLPIHNYPGDYYRFSPQVVRDVFFEGFAEVNVVSIMSPPRIIGYGFKP
jgi:ubiquinone/menaquinone biosynthesis C-methylase UbiE